MVKNQFIFHPVGQGLFYSGTIGDGQFNFVFDCGAEDDQQYLKREIEKLSEELSQLQQTTTLPQLDFVVISHLHYDHISGLELLQQNFHIKRVILPYINPQPDIIDLIVANSIFHEGNLSGEVGYRRYRNMRAYYGYARSENEDLPEPNVEIEFIREKVNWYDVDGQELYLQKETFANVAWEFVFANKTFTPEKLRKFSQRLQRSLHGHGFSTVQQLINAFRSGDNYQLAKKTLREVYNETFGKNRINETSTVLMHYPLTDANMEICAVPFYKTDTNVVYNCGYVSGQGDITLLTGDTVMDYTMLTKLTRWRNSDLKGIVQIPHHGAKDNYFGNKTNIILPDLWYNFEIQVVPYGLGNNYHHPQKDVCSDILGIGKLLLHATQNQGVWYEIEDPLCADELYADDQLLACEDDDLEDIQEEYLHEFNINK